MALKFPPEFPEPYTFPVIAAEGVARTVLAAELAQAEASYERGYRHRVEAAKQAALLGYLDASCKVFAAQGVLAVQQRAMAFSALDRTLEAFLECLQQHVFFGPLSGTIKGLQDFREYTMFKVNSARHVLTASWYADHLRALPGVLASLDEVEDLPPPGDARVTAKAARRRAFIMPKLAGRGLSVSKWVQLSGADRSSVYAYLAGQADPRPATIEVLAEALGVAPEDMP